MNKFIKLIFLTTLIISLSACKVQGTTFAYTVYPIGYLFDRIGGDKISTYQIQTNDLIQVATIKDDYQDVISNNTINLFHIGDLEPYLSIYNKELKENGVTFYDLSSKSTTYEFKRYNLVYVDSKANYIEGDYYNLNLFDKLDLYQKDLSIWVSPIAMLSMANDISTYLKANYVEQAQSFDDNYKSLENDLVRLDAEYQILSKSLKQQNKTVKFVSMTPSFGNWQKDYGFQVYPVTLSRYGTLPNEEQLIEIENKIIENQVKFIAFEPNMTDDMIDLFNYLQEKLDLTRVNLSNLSSLTDSQIEDNKDYITIMYENLNALENMVSDKSDNDSVNDMPLEALETEDN